MADVIVDASGSVAAQQVAVDLVRRGGKVVLGGRTPNKVIPFIMDKLSSRGITMIGVRAHEPQDVTNGTGAYFCAARRSREKRRRRVVTQGKQIWRCA